MSQLRIIFDGVIAIGPGGPRKASEGHLVRGPLFGIMPRATRQISRRSRLKADNPTYIPVHVPVLFTPMMPLAGTRRPDDHFRPVSPHSPCFNIWYPIRERLRFQFDGKEGPGNLIYKIDPTTTDFVAAGDIRAIADMREIWPERSSIRPEFVSYRFPAPPAVGAHVIVPEGQVSSGQYGREEGQGQDVSFLPPRTDTVVKKPCVPELIVTVDVQAVDIVSYSLETGEKLDGLSFRVPPNGGDIYVGNGDPGDVRMVIANVGQQVMNFRREEDDHDFELYYPLLAGEDDGEHLPAPRVRGGRFGTPHCYTLKVSGSGG